MEVQTACRSAKAPPPPPKLPNADLRAKVPPPPEPPDTGSLAATLLRPVPSPKSPNLDAEMLAEAFGSQITETFAGSTLLKKRPRMGWVLYKMGQNLDPLGQAQVNLSNEVHQSMSHEKRLLLSQIQEKCHGESIELVDVKAHQRYTLWVPSPGCAQSPPANPSKPPPWLQVTTKISVAPTPPSEPPDPGPRAPPPPLPDSRAASLLATGKEFISGEPSLMHAKQVCCVIVFVGKGLKRIGPKWVIREFNISLNLMGQTQGNVNVLGKECTTWAGIVSMVLSQFHASIWFQEKEVLDSPIPNPSNPNRKARGFAQSFLTFVFAVPIRSPMHCQIRAMLMTCILLDVEGSVRGGRHIQLPKLFARAFKCGSNAITMGIIVQYSLKWGFQAFGQEFDLHGYYEFVLYCGPEMEPVGEDRNIQIEDESVKEYTEEVEIIFSEYFLFGSLLDLIQSLEIFVAPRYAPIFLKQFITLAMNGNNREKEMVLALLSVHIAISSMEDIVGGFVMLLENVTANVVNMLLMNREVAALDILDSSSELASFLARAMIDDVLASLNLEESNCRLPPNGSENEVLQQAQSLVIRSSSSQQWDPGKRTWCFNYYRTRRVFGQICGGTQDAFNLLGIVLQWCFTLVLVKTTLVIGRDKLYSEDSSPCLRLEDKSVFQEGGNVRTQMSVGPSGLSTSVAQYRMMWQREREGKWACDVREFCYKNWGCEE